MVTFREYVSRSMDSLWAAFSSKETTNWADEKTVLLDFEEEMPVKIEYRIPTLNEADVRQLAYFKWEAAGRPEGDGREFWLAAEHELNSPLTEDLLLQR